MARLAYNAGREAAKLKDAKDREEKQKAAKKLAKKAERPASRRRNIRIAAYGSAAVLALVALLVVWPRRPDGMALASPRPEATITTPTFVWWSYPGVSTYELEIVTEAGEQVYATSTRDTTIQVSADHFEAGKKYLWLVRALANGQTKEASHIDRFTYQP
ncbi:MAG TPA: hypothetical protein VKH19_06485 [Gemmatimonadaceae bacterium]|nr:hypothetical protein [Gemmatimonadaceae bacterium]